MPDLTPNKTPGTTRNTAPNGTPNPTTDTTRDPDAIPDPVTGPIADPITSGTAEHRRPAGDRARATKRGDTVRAADTARPAEAARTGDTVRTGEAASPGTTALPGEAVLPGERGRTSAEPRGTTAVDEPTPLGSGLGTGAPSTGRAAGAGRDAGPLSASGEGATPRHRDAGAVDTVTGREPTATAGEHGGHGASLLPDDECDRIASRMRHAVVGFVDGPRDAVAEADKVLEELAAQFTDAVDRRRRTLRGTWQSGEGGKDRSATAATATDTEQLRLALRDYRELTERLLHL
ncbi:hypothetical protein J2X68_000242 [Streptomyces sp. 3330]|uniref:hypothetical protein n=1 Tax=Streptomyces sp. 3330 TaxID=2817755 RepID=UPI00285ED015|nr:hypothetical protein [Streptomyces sp. 3330]MDR6973573.1 hypothetical protein [Streptomyces sp. 3330]